MSEWLRRRNPLRCGGTPLPANVLLAAKLIVLSSFALGYVTKVPEPFLPLVPIFDLIPAPDLYRRALQGVMILAGASLLLNIRVRTCSFLVGLVFLLVPFGSRAAYTNGKFFCAGILILIGLWSGRHLAWLLRAQFVVMYLGASLNKLLDVDWRSGQYMDFWLGSLTASAPYREIAATLPDMSFAKFLCWGTIAAELALTVLLARPRTTRIALWILVVVHTVSIFLAGHTFAIFYAALLAACLVLVPWPEPGEVRVAIRGTGAFGRVMSSLPARLDFDGVFDWRDSRAGDPLQLGWRGRVYSGLSAFSLWLVLQPATYFAVWLMLMVPLFDSAYRAAAVVSLAALACLPTLGLGWRVTESAAP